MGKSKGVSKRRKKVKNQKFVRKSKLKKQRNKILKKSIKIECKPIRDAWNHKKNLNSNMESMGIALDPNKTISISNELFDKKEKKKNKSKTNDKNKVITDLETIANTPNEKNFRFGPQTVKFCVYMIEKYADNYEAMSRDKTNYYQLSSGQIKQKIKKFKSITTQYNSYERAKQMIDKEFEDMEEN